MNRLKQLRNELNMSQEELSKKLNLSKGIISMYEKEDRKPSLDVLISLSEIFNCSIDYIIGKSDKRNPAKTNENDFKFASYNGVDISELSEQQIEEVKQFVEFIKNKKKTEEKNE